MIKVVGIHTFASNYKDMDNSSHLFKHH